MDYLSLNNESLSREFIRDPQTLIIVLRQWLEFRKGKRCKEWFLRSLAGMELIDEAVRLARDRSPQIKRFYDDGETNEAPQLSYLNADRDSREEEESYSFETHLAFGRFRKEPL